MSVDFFFFSKCCQLKFLVFTQFADSAWEALRHIRQAVDFLVRVFFFHYEKRDEKRLACEQIET